MIYREMIYNNELMIPIYCSINSIREEGLQAMTDTNK